MEDERKREGREGSGEGENGRGAIEEGEEGWIGVIKLSCAVLFFLYQSLLSHTGAGIMLRRKITQELSRSLASPWTPSFCKTRSVAWSSKGEWWLEGARSVHPYHTSDLQAPKGTGDLTIKIPKGKQAAHLPE